MNPYDYYFIAFAFLIVIYTHLSFGFWLVRKSINPKVFQYFRIRILLSVAYLFFISEEQRFESFYILFPLYLINYVDGLLLVNGRGVRKCETWKEAIYKLITFRSPDK